MASAMKTKKSGWVCGLALAAACGVLVVGALPSVARADSDGKHRGALRQSGHDSRHSGRGDHGYGKRHGDNYAGNYGRYDRGHRGDGHGGNAAYYDRGSRGDYQRGGSYDRPRVASHRYSGNHYSYVQPPVYRRHGYRPPVYYYPGYYRPPVHIVRPPLPRYTTIHVSGYPYPYYYDAGIFYRPYGSNFWLSVSAPIGARVHALPAGYVTFGYGGHTYYQAHSTYYMYDRPASQYVVVEPPAGAPPAQTGSGSNFSEELYVYPARGQSEETTQRDRYDCHVWAVSEVGVDPSFGGADAETQLDYRRALTACLEGRGYTVR